MGEGKAPPNRQYGSLDADVQADFTNSGQLQTRTPYTRQEGEFAVVGYVVKKGVKGKTFGVPRFFEHRIEHPIATGVNVPRALIWLML